MCWLPWPVKLQYGFLRLGYFVTGRYSTAIQDTANLTELAQSRLKVIDPLGWDVWMPWSFCRAFSRSFFFRPTPPRLSPGRYTSINLPEIELICMKSHKRELVWTFT